MPCSSNTVHISTIAHRDMVQQSTEAQHRSDGVTHTWDTWAAIAILRDEVGPTFAGEKILDGSGHSPRFTLNIFKDTVTVSLSESCHEHCNVMNTGMRHNAGQCAPLSSADLSSTGLVYRHRCQLHTCLVLIAASHELSLLRIVFFISSKMGKIHI